MCGPICPAPFSVQLSPSLMRDIKLVEQVQRRSTKRLHGYHEILYAERLIGPTIIDVTALRPTV